MRKNTQPLTENSVIDWSSPLGDYRNFFMKALDLKSKPDKSFYFWLNTQTGKKLKDAMEAYGKEPERNSIEEILSEERFHIISDTDKTFIAAVDKELGKMGYDSGGSIVSGKFGGKFMIVYSPKDSKSKKIIARIFMNDNEISLKFNLNDIGKHQSYIKNAPEHIKDVFTNEHGSCRCGSKKENCRMRKIYTIGDKRMEKCSIAAFQFRQPTIEKLPDYMSLLIEFYPLKKSKG